MLRYMQRALKPRESGELQKRAVLIGRNNFFSPLQKIAQPLPFSQVPVWAVAGVAGGGEGAGSPMQAGLGLAGTVPKLAMLTRKQSRADAGVTWRE